MRHIFVKEEGISAFNNVLQTVLSQIKAQNIVSISHSTSKIYNGSTIVYSALIVYEQESTREQAMKWWNELSDARKTQICDSNTQLVGSIRRWESLTGREIESIYQSHLIQSENGHQ